MAGRKEVWTVNVAGNQVANAKAEGYNAYHASGVTAVEIPATGKADAGRKARKAGFKVLFVFL